MIIDDNAISYAVISGKDIVVGTMSLGSYNKICRTAKSEGRNEELDGYNYSVIAGDGTTYYFKAAEEKLPIMPEPEESSCVPEKPQKKKKSR